MKTLHASQTSAVNRFAWLQANVFKAESLSSTARLVACAMVSYVNDKTLACFPKIATIAQATQLNERTVRNAINELIAHNLVSKNSHALGFMRNRNSYQLVAIGECITAKQPAKAASRTKAGVTSGSKPARDSGSAAESDSGSFFKNTDTRNTDGRDRSDTSPTRPNPADDNSEQQLIEVVTKRWQQLSRDPWTNASARQHVDIAVSRAGIDAVTVTLNEICRGNRTLPRTALLDILQAIGTTQANPQLGDSVELLGNVPDVWASIAQDFARHPLLDCPLPFSWLKLITARISDGFIELSPKTPLVRDQLRNRFHQLLSDCCRKHGLQLAVA
tara:strand:+ start:17152 stop:18147 length:996 start_codon:yes stop_codon:yes gene_type:complete